jgi:hypothetical protein
VTKAIRVVQALQAQSAQQVLKDRLGPLALKALKATQEILKGDGSNACAADRRAGDIPPSNSGHPVADITGVVTSSPSYGGLSWLRSSPLR